MRFKYKNHKKVDDIGFKFINTIKYTLIPEPTIDTKYIWTTTTASGSTDIDWSTPDYDTYTSKTINYTGVCGVTTIL